MVLRTQMDHVKQDKGFQPEYVERKVAIPGLQNLHEKPVQEIAEVIANVLRTERNVVEFHYVLGESITLIVRPDNPGYL